MQLIVRIQEDVKSILFTYAFYTSICTDALKFIDSCQLNRKVNFTNKSIHAL